eukprot:GHVU01002059.1.p1 GENE.GHVU01002059.1~~GHVU01002059.1.p1  ORF type:complete len:529 (+),score=48.91 GHVU01002059.1:91-1587(+)
MAKEAVRSLDTTAAAPSLTRPIGPTPDQADFPRVAPVRLPLHSDGYWDFGDAEAERATPAQSVNSPVEKTLLIHRLSDNSAISTVIATVPLLQQVPSDFPAIATIATGEELRLLRLRSVFPGLFLSLPPTDSSMSSSSSESADQDHRHAPRGPRRHLGLMPPKTCAMAVAAATLTSGLDACIPDDLKTAILEFSYDLPMKYLAGLAADGAPGTTAHNRQAFLLERRDIASWILAAHLPRLREMEFPYPIIDYAKTLLVEARGSHGHRSPRCTAAFLAACNYWTCGLDLLEANPAARMSVHSASSGGSRRRVVAAGVAAAPGAAAAAEGGAAPSAALAPADDASVARGAHPPADGEGQLAPVANGDAPRGYPRSDGGAALPGEVWRPHLPLSAIPFNPHARTDSQRGSTIGGSQAGNNGRGGGPRRRVREGEARVGRPRSGGDRQRNDGDSPRNGGDRPPPRPAWRVTTVPVNTEIPPAIFAEVDPAQGSPWRYISDIR